MKAYANRMLLPLLAACLVLTGACQRESEHIKVGVVGVLSGPQSAYGLSSLRATEMVAEQWNAKGGLLGRQIELVAEDDECRSEKAAICAARVLGEGVVGVIGHSCSDSSRSALSLYQSSGIPMISPVSTSPLLNADGRYPNFFRTIAPDDAQAAVDADFIANVLKLKSVAILHDNQGYGKGFVDLTRAELEKLGVEVIFYDGIVPDASDYMGVLTQIKESKAEGLLYGGYHPEASRLVRQMHQLEMDIPFISDDSVQVDRFIHLAGAFADGAYASGPMDTSTNPMNIMAMHRYIEKYGEEPSAYFVTAYSAAIALFTAIEEAGTTESQAILNVLHSRRFDTPLGNIGFSEKGDPLGVNFSMYRVINGQFVELDY